MSDSYMWEAEWKAVHIAHLVLTGGNPTLQARQLCYPRTGKEFQEVCRLLDSYGWRDRLADLGEISAAWDQLVSVWETVESDLAREIARSGSESLKTDDVLSIIEATGYYEAIAKNIQKWMGQDISVEFLSDITGVDEFEIESLRDAQGHLITPFTLLLLSRGLNKPLEAFFELPTPLGPSQPSPEEFPFAAS